MMVVNPANDILKQAHQGSVAAIIQVLNDKLVDRGVRTRAVFAKGVLQLLCEAATEAQLEQTTLIDRVRQILETIAPRNIRRVNINSRIVREQQLLWLEEINRDSDNQLLWSQEIVLKGQNPLKRWAEDLGEALSAKTDLPKPTSIRTFREQRQFRRGILGGLGLSTALLLAGWGIYQWQGKKFLASNSQTASIVTNSVSQPAADSSASAKTPAVASSAKPIAAKQDPFAAAVRLAEKASETGKAAKTPEQWRELADMWGKASELMAQVPNNDQRYAVAQDRTNRYRANQELALRNVR